MQPLLYAIHAIRDLPEIVPATALLGLVKDRMVRGNHLSHRMMQSPLAATGGNVIHRSYTHLEDPSRNSALEGCCSASPSDRGRHDKSGGLVEVWVPSVSQPRAAVMSCAIIAVAYEDSGAVILTECS